MYQNSILLMKCAVLIYTAFELIKFLGFFYIFGKYKSKYNIQIKIF